MNLRAQDFTFLLILSFCDSFLLYPSKAVPLQHYDSSHRLVSHLNVAGPLERTKTEEPTDVPDNDPLDSLRSVVNDVLQIFSELPGSISETDDEFELCPRSFFEKTMKPLSSEISACESVLLTMAAGDRKEEAKAKSVIREILDPLRPFIKKSPGMHHSLEWPRGYAGDFEMIQTIMENNNTVDKANAIGYLLQGIMLKQDICEQHRNKMKYQGEVLIRGCMERKKSIGETAEILTLACGPCPDLQMIQGDIEKSDVHFTLLEKDIGAIQFSQSILNARVLEKCDFVEGNVLHLHRGTVVECIPLKGYDLVLAGGLFDYLSGKMITRLLAYAWNDLLAPGGSIFFTNVIPEYKARFHTEAILNWSLIGRSVDELLNLCEQAGIPKDCVSTMHESTGITVMVTCYKSLDDKDVLQ